MKHWIMACVSLGLVGCATTAAPVPAPQTTAVTWVMAQGSYGPAHGMWVRRLATYESCIVETLPGDGNRNLSIGVPGRIPRVSVHFRGKKTDEKEAMQTFLDDCGLPPKFM